MPVTIPVAGSIVAVRGVTELQTPPAAASLKVMVEPWQTVTGPVIVPASGVALTVTTLVAAAVPQLLLTV